MNKTSPLLAALVAIAAGLSISCTSGLPAAAPSPGAIAGPAGGSPPSLTTTYGDLGRAGGNVIALDPAASVVRIYVFRDGRAARLGHNHVLAAPRFEGFFHLPDSGAADARFDLAFRLDELEIDNPAWRAGLGSAFASVLSAEAIQGTRDHMLGEANMEAARYPLVQIHSLRISGEAPHYAAQVAVRMHGQAREMWIPLTVDGLPGRLSVNGSFVLRQTDFGIKPYSVAGGLLAVKDEVIVDFRLEGR